MLTISKLQNFYHKFLSMLIRYSHSKYAIPILIVVSFTESSFFIAPPDFLLIPMAYAVPKRALSFALITTIFSVLGGLFGYFIGYFLYEGWLKEFITTHYSYQFDLFYHYYNEYGMLAILIGGFSPIPYKLVTIASGVFNMNLVIFVTGSIISRGLRFFLLAYMIKHYHKNGVQFIVNNFKKIMTVSIIISIIIIIALVIYYLI